MLVYSNQMTYLSLWAMFMYRCQQVRMRHMRWDRSYERSYRLILGQFGWKRSHQNWHPVNTRNWLEFSYRITVRRRMVEW